MLNFTSSQLKKSKVDNLAIPVCEDEPIHESQDILDLISLAKGHDGFSGEKGQQIILYDLLDGAIQRCLFLGIGSRAKVEAETLRTAAGRAVKNAMTAKCKQLIIVPPSQSPIGDERIVIKAIAEGAFLANHSFPRYKEKPKNDLLKKISLLVSAQEAKRQKQVLKQVEAVCKGTLLAREWINTASNDKVPETLAQNFQKAARQAGIAVRVMNQTQLDKQKFNALMAVAQGSVHQPRLVEMTYTPAKAQKTVVLVGKGVTFDTGGISLKPSAGMGAMKADMSGAAAVAATMTAIAALKPKHRVIGITPLVENMPSGSATRPGDIITSYAGKSVEIGNTDAEGRLILADAMAYAVKKYKPDLMIDLATLTGACVVALGEKLAGVFSRDAALSEAIVTAGNQSHERCWPMPMPDEYKELLKSDYADINNNASSRYGGAITAALFLAEFVGETCWAHVDIAGPAFLSKGGDYCGPGGTGFGVRLLCEWLINL